jgi:hypothetical protein
LPACQQGAKLAQHPAAKTALAYPEETGFVNYRPIKEVGMNTRLFFVCLNLALLLFIGYVRAAPTTYTNRTSWEGDLAISPDFFVDFNGFTSDVSFKTTPLDIGPFTMQQVGSQPGYINIVDAPPFTYPSNTVDGTPHLSIFVGDPLTVTMTFDVPIFSWFGDFYAAGNTSELKMTLVSNSGNNTVSVPGPGTSFQSFGFIDSSIAYNQIIFNNSVNDGFALDNVAGTNVPVPPSLLLLLSGLIGLLGFRKKYKK